MAMAGIPQAAAVQDDWTRSCDDVVRRRRILCVSPPMNSGLFAYSYSRHFGWKGFMPQQGLLTVAAYMPKQWEIRFVDEDTTELRDEDFAWADAVMVSGMHSQRKRMEELALEARRRGVVSIVGGSSVSACPEYHRGYDILHLGELGDATDALIHHLDRSIERPERQIEFRTQRRLPIEDFPIPAYDLIDMNDYMALTIQWSSGCPYTCEFCDIPALYGRKARAKSPERLIRELNEIAKQRPMGAIWFVDDNLIANKKRAKDLMPHLIRWQETSPARVPLVAEATINLARDPEMLELLRRAHFTAIFVGLESGDAETLAQTSKQQNLQIPIDDAVKAFNAHGIELYTGIILGFDADYKGPSDTAADKVVELIDRTQIPSAAVNILYALPRTALWDRMEREGRLVPDEEVNRRKLESNIVFNVPIESLIRDFRNVVDRLFEPSALYRRYWHQLEHTYPNRAPMRVSRSSLSIRQQLKAARIVASVLVSVGILAPYRMEFWRFLYAALRRGMLDAAMEVAVQAHHFIRYREDVLEGAEMKKGRAHYLYVGERA